jgi:hypothetical protein
MYREHGYAFVAQKTVVFRNLKASYAESGRIRFGYASLRYSHDHGFEEYTTIKRAAWGNTTNLTGLRGVWAEVLHEFAHVVQMAEERLYSKTGHRNKFHNEQFIDALQQLRVLYPFEEATQ